MPKTNVLTGKWVVIYLGLCVLPLILFFLQPFHLSVITHPSLNPFFIYAPDLLLILVALLGWKIAQTRIFWASLVDLLLYQYLLYPGGWVALPADRLRTFEILTVGLPLFWLILFSIKECRLLSEQSLSRVALALSPLLVLMALSGWAPDIHRQVLHWKYFGGAWAVWPELSVLTFLCFGAVIYFLDDTKIKRFLFSFLIARLPLYLALYLALVLNDPNLTAMNHFLVIVSYLAISIIFLHVILHMYWNRVYQDALTRVPNRQALDDRLHTLHGPYSLAMVDIDHFKKFNDTYGHAEGDHVLRMVAQHLMAHLGKDIYRYGGEEFCVVFEGEKREEAEALMEEARKTLAERAFSLRNIKRREGEEPFLKPVKKPRGDQIKITISVGVANHKASSVDYHDVIKRADKALYAAKNGGRNKVVKAG